MRKRTRAREIALQMLSLADTRGEEALAEVDDTLRMLYKLDRDGEVKAQDIDEDLLHFARQLVDGTLEMRPGIDEVISNAAQNWHLSRMAIVDRNILRMAVYEMLHDKDIPAKVSINEAIELGKQFSTGQSGSFINGILDRIRREHGI